MGTSRLRNVAAWTAIAVCLAATACGSGASSSAGTALTDITVGNIGTFDVYNYVVAQKLGLWQAAGLRATPEQFSAPLVEVPALTNGNLDFAYTGPGAVHLAMQGEGVVIAVNDLSITDYVIARPPITSLADLKGQTVAFGQGTVGQILLLLALQQVGLTLKDINMVNIPQPSGIVSAFLSHQVNAVATWAPFGNQVLKQDPTAKALATDRALYPKVVIPDTWQVSPTLLKNKPDVVKRFLWVQMKVNAWLSTHIQQAIDWASAYLKQPTSEVATTAPPDNGLYLTPSQVLPYYRDGTASKWFDALGNIFVQEGTMTSIPPQNTWLDFGPALSVQGKLSASTYSS